MYTDACISNPAKVMDVYITIVIIRSICFCPTEPADIHIIVYIIQEQALRAF